MADKDRVVIVKTPASGNESAIFPRDFACAVTSTGTVQSGTGQMKPDKTLPNWGGLLSILEGRDPRIGAEVGIWTGENSVSLLDRFPALRMVVIDPFDSDVPCKNKISFEEAERTAVVALAPFWERVHWLKMYSHLASAIFSDSSFDFVFIDADHRYESVKQDIADWRVKIKPGGILAGHDYKYPGKRHAGVKRAVDEAFGNRINIIPWPCTVWWIEL